jgi:hypothetical protein
MLNANSSIMPISDHEHGECYGIVVEPMPPMHDYAPPFPAVLVALAGRMVQMWRRAQAAEESVSGAFP